MAIILDGKKLSEKILEDLRDKVEKSGLKLRMAVVLVGDNPASLTYIRQKEKACQKAGFDFLLYKFPQDIKEDELAGEVEKIVKDPENSGVIVQLPLPQGMDSQKILNIIPPEKDVDVLSEKSWEKLEKGEFPILPPTLGGIVRLLEEYKINVEGKNAVVVGKGRLVGNPAAWWLGKQGASVSIADSSTSDLTKFTQEADIIVSGVGKPNLITGDMVKEGVVVIDAGTSVSYQPSASRFQQKGIVLEKPKAESRKLRAVITGDVDFESISQKASYITPVPGGVGPMTVAILLENLYKLCSGNWLKNTQ